MVHNTCFLKIFFSLLLLLQVHFGCAQTSEYSLKAVWIENFTRFITWPDQTVQDTFYIKILGKGQLNVVLKEVYKTRQIQGKTIKVIEVNSLAEANNCHILFINKEYEAEIPQILDQLKEQPILTISDSKGFSHKGIIINFYLEDNKVRFEFNITTFKETKMDVNFRLLEVAKVIKKS